MEAHPGSLDPSDKIHGVDDGGDGPTRARMSVTGAGPERKGSKVVVVDQRTEQAEIRCGLAQGPTPLQQFYRDEGSPPVYGILQ